MFYNTFKFCFLFILTFLLDFNYAQNNDENANYIINKELELTNDSSYWDNHSEVYLGLNRVHLYNWAAGGMNFMELHGLANLRFDYRHNKFHWNNFINIQFGVFKQGYGDEGVWLKNDDLIQVRTKFARRTNHLWDYTFLVDVRTQFDYGYYTEWDRKARNYMDNFLSPIYPIFGLGLDFHVSNRLTVDVSPLTVKNTIVLDDSLSRVGVFGLDAGEKIRTEAGLYLNLLYTHDSLFNIKNLHFMSDVTLFGNYLEEPGNIDVTCEFLLSYSINKFFSVTFQSYLIYDHDINIPRYNSDLTPVYLERPAGEVDPRIGGNHYFVEYNEYYADPGFDWSGDGTNSVNYIGYTDFDVDGDGFTDNGFKIVKSGPTLQFLEYWMIGLSFSF